MAVQGAAFTTPPGPSPLDSLSRLITSLAEQPAQSSGTRSASAATPSSTKHLVRRSYSVILHRSHCDLSAAVNEVEDEPLDAFSGILGLALPLNSVIFSSLGADGATWASNLFGMDGAPASRFISFLLERPGSTKIPSLLGIGMHPADYVPDPSKVYYSQIVSEDDATFWKTSVSAITVYTDSVRKEVNISPSSSGSAFPTAVLDTGIPVILTTSAIANGIYGALDVHPASDGNCEWA